MRASSLFFVVIVAVWLMYAGQQWVRRREDLTTARTVDRFSDAMRMLERRPPLRHERSVTQHETRPAVLKAEVSVKGAPTTNQEAETMKVDASQIRSHLPKAKSREVKASALLASVVFLVITLGLAPFGLISWWFPVIGLLLTAGVVTWLRQDAIAQRRRASQPAKATARPIKRATPQVATKAPRTSGGSTAVTPAAASAGAAKREASRPVRPEVDKVAQRQAPRAPQAQAEVKQSPLLVKPAAPEQPTDRADDTPEEAFDQEAVAAQQAVAKAASDEVFDAGWAPVDVPRPTYTMKAKAERDEVAPAATVDQVDPRPLAAQYADTPVEELPFDGMALDEDYDELPAVYRAG